MRLRGLGAYARQQHQERRCVALTRRKQWLLCLVAAPVLAGSLLGAACDDDADSPDEIQDTAEEGIEDVGNTAEDIADDAQDDVDDAIGDDATESEDATETPEP
jgi:hypothetical protein